MTLALLGLAYLLGATPTSYWIGRWAHGVDLRRHGSGNLGAANALRILGWKSAVPVITVDIAKGFVPTWLFPSLVDASYTWTLAFGAAAILGHVFSPWVRFRGGKGIATGMGVFLSLAPVATSGAFLVWTLLILRSRIASLGSIGAAVSLPILVAVTSHEGGRSLVVFSAVSAVFFVWAHRANVGRLLRGEESRLGEHGHPSTAVAGHTPSRP